MGQGAQNMKTGPDALSTTETSPDAQIMKTGHVALGTVENKSKRKKHENETRSPRYR
jgi:hypothetical protein